MEFNEIAQTSLLYDFYGQLLTERQREVMELYHEENLTLSEIADEFSISRQGVHDTLKTAEKALQIGKIDREIDGLAAECTDKRTAEKLRKIKEIIDSLDQ